MLQRANLFLAVIVFLGSEMISRKEKENKTKTLQEEFLKTMFVTKRGGVLFTNISHVLLLHIGVSQTVCMESRVYDIKVLRQKI